MKRNKTTMLATGALTAALVLGGIGYAYGETAPDTTVDSGWLGGAMHRAGGGLAQIVADVTGLDIKDVADRRAEGESFEAIAEAEGADSQDVKDAAVAEFESSLDDRMSSTDPMPRRGTDRGDMRGRPDGVRPESVLADLAGLEISDIHDLRVEGQSLAQIAADEGVDIDVVIDTVLESAETNLDAAVEAGRIDAEQKAEILENMAAQLDEIVNSTEVPSRDGKGGPRGGRGMSDDGPPADAGTATL